MPTPMTRSMPRAPAARSSASRSTSSRPAVGPNARSMSAISRQRRAGLLPRPPPAPRPGRPRCRRGPARGEVPGRREERLPVDHAVGGAVDDALVGQPRPVVAAHQRRLAEPEHVEEPVERVVAVERRPDRRSAASTSFALASSTSVCGPQRALDVAVQLDLGSASGIVPDVWAPFEANQGRTSGTIRKCQPRAAGRVAAQAVRISSTGTVNWPSTTTSVPPVTPSRARGTPWRAARSVSAAASVG